MKSGDQKITKTAGETPTARLESQMLNETFNNIPVQETTDEDTIVYTAGNHYWH